MAGSAVAKGLLCVPAGGMPGRCGRCMPCIARVARRHARCANRRGFALEPPSVLRSICYYEPAQPPLRICVFLDCPHTSTRHIEHAANTLACYARQTTTIGRFAVARQKRTVRKSLLYQKMLRKHWHSRIRDLPLQESGGTDYVTAWMELITGPRPNFFYRPYKDLVHIKGNQLAQEFSDNKTLDQKKKKESNISWSPSFVREIHNRTYAHGETNNPVK